MSNNVVFEDYSVNVKNAIRDKTIAFLHEVGGELRSQTSRNSRRKSGDTAGKYEYKVEESNLCVHIGSNYQNAIWEEFGTGSFALNGDGRKGWWVYVTGANPADDWTPSHDGKTYSLQGAKKAVAILRKKGLDAHYTKGKTANRPLWKAFESSKSRIIRKAEELFGGLSS